LPTRGGENLHTVTADSIHLRRIQLDNASGCFRKDSETPH